MGVRKVMAYRIWWVQERGHNRTIRLRGLKTDRLFAQDVHICDSFTYILPITYFKPYFTFRFLTIWHDTYQDDDCSQTTNSHIRHWTRILPHHHHSAFSTDWVFNIRTASSLPIPSNLNYWLSPLESHPPTVPGVRRHGLTRQPQKPLAIPT